MQPWTPGTPRPQCHTPSHQHHPCCAHAPSQQAHHCGPSLQSPHTGSKPHGPTSTQHTAGTLHAPQHHARARWTGLRSTLRHQPHPTHSVAETHTARHRQQGCCKARCSRAATHARHTGPGPPPHTPRAARFTPPAADSHPALPPPLGHPGGWPRRGDRSAPPPASRAGTSACQQSRPTWPGIQMMMMMMIYTGTHAPPKGDACVDDDDWLHMGRRTRPQGASEPFGPLRARPTVNRPQPQPGVHRARAAKIPPGRGFWGTVQRSSTTTKQCTDNM